MQCSRWICDGSGTLSLSLKMSDSLTRSRVGGSLQEPAGLRPRRAAQSARAFQRDPGGGQLQPRHLGGPGRRSFLRPQGGGRVTPSILPAAGPPQKKSSHLNVFFKNSLWAKIQTRVFHSNVLMADNPKREFMCFYWQVKKFPVFPWYVHFLLEKTLKVFTSGRENFPSLHK